MTVSMILLAGGNGTRLGHQTPKQFLYLDQEPIALHSYKVLCSSPKAAEIIIVCPAEYRDLFKPGPIPIKFALPGKERQDSVRNGFEQINPASSYVCIHDSARPLIDAALVERVIHAGMQHGAATVGMPIKFTIKTIDNDQFVVNTPNRSTLWEIQTPQVIRKDWLSEGLEMIKQESIAVTDDVTLVEMLGHPVKVVTGSYSNLKITTPEDFVLAKHLIHK